MKFNSVHSIKNPKIKLQVLSKLKRQEQEKENKYKNKHTIRIINGKPFKFDSKKEAEYYDELSMKLRAGLITNYKNVLTSFLQ